MAPILAAAAASWYEGPEGEYPIAGAVQAVVATITDDDLLVDEDERLSLKRTRSELVNTIAGTYSSPDAFYDGVPLATRTDAAAFAADRERLAASIPYEAVTDPVVGDRLNDIALRASRYQANAEICLRQKYLFLKVGQWIRWQSGKAGGFAKTFQIVRRRLGPLGPKACRAVYVTLQEVGDGVFDPTAYKTLPPDASGVGAPDYQSELVNFQVAGTAFTASTGSKRAGIRATWNQIEDPTITFVDLEYGPIAATGQVPAAVATKQAKSDQVKEDLYEGVMSSSLWAVRYTLRSDPPRTFFASGWYEVTTPNAQLTNQDVYLPGMVDEINQHTADMLAPLNVSLRDLVIEKNKVAREALSQDAGQYLDKEQAVASLRSAYRTVTADYQSLVGAQTGPGSAIVRRLDTFDAVIPMLATASALNATIVRVSNLEGVTTAQASQISTLNAALPGKADVSALNSVSATVTAQGNTISAQGTQLSGLSTTVGNFSASGLFRTAVVATEAGAQSTIGISVSATAGGASALAAILLSAVAGGDSMIGLVASKVYMTDGAGNKAYPFVFSSGVARLENIVVGTVKFDQLYSNNGKLIIRGSGSLADISGYV